MQLPWLYLTLGLATTCPNIQARQLESRFSKTALVFLQQEAQRYVKDDIDENTPLDKYIMFLQEVGKPFQNKNRTSTLDGALLSIKAADYIDKNETTNFNKIQELIVFLRELMKNYATSSESQIKVCQDIYNKFEKLSESSNVKPYQYAFWLSMKRCPPLATSASLNDTNYRKFSQDIESADDQEEPSSINDLCWRISCAFKHRQDLVNKVQIYFGKDVTSIFAEETSTHDRKHDDRGKSKHETKNQSQSHAYNSAAHAKQTYILYLNHMSMKIHCIYFLLIFFQCLVSRNLTLYDFYLFGRGKCTVFYGLGVSSYR